MSTGLAEKPLAPAKAATQGPDDVAIPLDPRYRGDDDRPGGSRWRLALHALYYLALVAIVATLTHFFTLLTIPSVAERDAYARVAALGAPFKTMPLPPAGPKARDFPYSDPAMAASICLYDLAGGPVRARLALGRAAFSALSFHSRRGVVFYALTDRAANKGKMEALIVTPEQLRTLVSHDDEDNPSDDLRIVSPTSQGFAMARVLTARPDQAASAADEAAAMTCAPESVAETEK